ncbi:MAG TPA: helix-turn-helix transcriptional regulator [Nocardioides sp.]|uniref:helix-turn-helix domain-containing protein n=1 Tax=Nocardioides sp. TaxID=35761 RepID=UPI002EDA5687
MPATEPLGPMVRLKEVRTKLTTLTQEQLAERIREQGVPITNAGVSNVENGNKVASDRLLTAWAIALGLDPLLVWQGPLVKPVEPGIPLKKASGL